MSTLAAGDTSIEIPDVKRGDEIGTMAQATLKFRDAAIEKARLEAETAERDRKAAAERAAAEAKIMNEFEAAVGGIVKAALAGDFSQRVSLEGKQGVIRNLAESHEFAVRKCRPGVEGNGCRCSARSPKAI